jgi:nucleoid-associated protein YgaU
MFGSGLDTEHAFEQDGAMGRTYVRRRRTVAVAAAVLLGAVLAGPVAGALAGPRVAPEPTSYVIRSGDTLWGIVARLRPGGDPRPLIRQIQQLNGVDAGSLVPGRTLLVPPAA